MALKRSELTLQLARAPKLHPVISRTASSDPSPFSRPAAVLQPSPEEIAVAAYYRAKARGFSPGHEIEDWLAAERELTENRG